MYREKNARELGRHQRALYLLCNSVLWSGPIALKGIDRPLHKACGGMSVGVWVGMIVIVISVIVTRLFLTRWTARWLKNNPEEE